MRAVLTRALLTIGLITAGPSVLLAQQERIVEWVENASSSDNTKIALGYPVPIPVNTPLPFDGFRSYAGLHTRHQDLSMTTPWVHAKEIGTTRNGRTIWAYQLGDADLLTPSGSREHAMLTNGGIHAREWQSPEVATGIIELLALSEDDQHLISYLRDNANIVVIPVLNVDGFLQTQRYPRHNWLGTDPDDPEYSPRDGRMRRKNMLGPDENLQTQGDHLLGVDLNRNNPPNWATDPQNSSDNPEDLSYHGASSQSEPETQALATAATLGPADKLSMYTDMHSYTQRHLWVRNDNQRLRYLTENLLHTFSDFHRSFPSRKNYSVTTPINQGFGPTDDYFLETYQVPSWTLEIEPTYHGGADYGGWGRNGHEGFFLPDSEVERVRTELAQTFAVAYYRQSGPPSISSFRLIDKTTNAVVFEAEWDTQDTLNRQMYSFQAQAVQLGREYTAWIAWDKPMRWRTDGEVTPLPGQDSSTLDFDQSTRVDNAQLESTAGDENWLNMQGGSPGGFMRYRDDALNFDLTYLENAANRELVPGVVTANFEILTSDMTGYPGDSNPATVARWENGAWSGYENTSGEDGTDAGGIDSTIQFLVTSEKPGDPFVVEAGTSAAWFDPERNGEGFILEILSSETALMYWFTYDSEGKQDWYIAEGEIQANRIVFPELVQVSGGEFGPGFDPEKVVRTVVGSASFIWASCGAGVMEWALNQEGNKRQQGRMDLLRLSWVMGLDCGNGPLPPERPEGRLSGSWSDPSHSGEGYVLEVMTNQQVLVYWFGFDNKGNRRWFFGTGEIVDDKLGFDEIFTTHGGIFGAGFDPTDISVEPWGSLELSLNCEGGTARYESSEEDFSAGELDVIRVTILDGLSCDS
jgi:hypothetical protein